MNMHAMRLLVASVLSLCASCQLQPAPECDWNAVHEDTCGVWPERRPFGKVRIKTDAECAIVTATWRASAQFENGRIVPRAVVEASVDYQVAGGKLTIDQPRADGEWLGPYLTGCKAYKTKEAKL